MVARLGITIIPPEDSGGGGSGSGTVTSISGTAPIVVTPSPLTGAGIISHANSGVTAALYGDATHVPQITVNATGHITLASSIAIAPPPSITASAPVAVTPSPITGTGVISHLTSGAAAGSYGDSTHIPIFIVDAFGHITSVSSVAVAGTSLSITGTAPIVVTPSPITNVGTISHGNSGVAAGMYGDALHVPQITVDVRGHITAVTAVNITAAGGGSVPTFISVLTTGPFTLPASPSGANAIEIIMQAAGAGGGGNTGSGGGSGEYMRRTFPIGPGVAYSGTVGAAGTSSASVGTAGGDTTFSDGTTTYTVKGGLPGNSTAAGGQAGGRLGPVGGAYPSTNVAGNPGQQAVIEGVDTISGSSGGSPGFAGGNNAGGIGGGCEENLGGAAGLGATSRSGGGGGGGSRFGRGGAGGNANAGSAGNPGNAPLATAYGAGGGGGAQQSNSGGVGIQGFFLYRYV